jgi:hypothetical protein
VQYASAKDGHYSDSYVVPRVNIPYNSSISIYYKVVGVDDGELTAVRWFLGGLDYTESFSKTVSIDDENKKITFYRPYDFDCWWMYGTPSVDKIELATSALEINMWSTNIGIDGQNYYIRIAETSGWESIVDTSYKYQVTHDTQNEVLYYLVVINETNQKTYYYQVYGTQSNWFQVY